MFCDYCRKLMNNVILFIEPLSIPACLFSFVKGPRSQCFRRSVNVWGVVNFASIYRVQNDPEQSTFPCSSRSNPSEQKPNQTKTG